MVDEPVSELAAGPGAGAARRADRADAGRDRRRYTAAGHGLRAAPGGRRLAALHPAGIRRLRGAVRPGRAVGPADPGGAGDAGRGRLQAAGDPVADLRHPGCQLRRRDPYPGDPRPGRGVRHRTGQRCVPLPDHHAVPGEARAELGRRAAAAGPVPARRRRRACRCPRDDRPPSPTPRVRGRRAPAEGARRRRGRAPGAPARS